MAYFGMRPQAIPALQQFLNKTAMFKTQPLTDFAGTPIDFSTWLSFECDVFQNSSAGPPYAKSIPGPIIGVVGNADGTLTIEVDPVTNPYAVVGQSVPLSIVGKAPGAPDTQIVAYGSIQMMTG